MKNSKKKTEQTTSKNVLITRIHEAFFFFNTKHIHILHIIDHHHQQTTLWPLTIHLFSRKQNNKNSNNKWEREKRSDIRFLLLFKLHLTIIIIINLEPLLFYYEFFGKKIMSPSLLLLNELKTILNLIEPKFNKIMRNIQHHIILFYVIEFLLSFFSQKNNLYLKTKQKNWQKLFLTTTTTTKTWSKPLKSIINMKEFRPITWNRQTEW